MPRKRFGKPLAATTDRSADSACDKCLGPSPRVPEPDCGPHLAAGQAYLRVSSSSTSNTSEAPGGITRPAPSAP